MPIVKGLRDMVEKYSLKYDQANYTAAITAVKTLMESAYQAGHSVIYDVVERVRGILDSEGVPSTLWGIYLAFAQKLASKTFSFSIKTLQTEASALKAEFVAAHGADPDILDKIIEAILGSVPTY